MPRHDDIQWKSYSVDAGKGSADSTSETAEETSAVYDHGLQGGRKVYKEYESRPDEGTHDDTVVYKSFTDEFDESDALESGKNELCRMQIEDTIAGLASHDSRPYSEKMDDVGIKTE
jgi:hypothetical protein